MASDIRPTTGDSSWFVHDRFGLFIHWGLYAMGARHEWMMTCNPDTKRLYVHLLAWPYRYLHLDGKAYTDRVESAHLLHDASEVSMGMPASTPVNPA
jgi:hypothetical protein